MKKQFKHHRRVLTETMLQKLCMFLYQLECVSSVYVNIELKDGSEISAIRNLDTVQAEKEAREAEKEFNPRKYFKD